MKGYGNANKLVIKCATCGGSIMGRNRYTIDAVCVECSRKRARERASDISGLKGNRLAVLERRRNRYEKIVAEIEEEIKKIKNEPNGLQEKR